MKTNLRTFTFCVKIQGCEEPGSYLQIFVGLYWTRLETRRQIAKTEMRLKRKKEKRKNEKTKKIRGFIKGRAPGKLTGCEHDFARLLYSSKNFFLIQGTIKNSFKLQ